MTMIIMILINLKLCLLFYYFAGATHSTCRKLSNMLSNRVVSPVMSELLKSIQYGKSSFNNSLHVI